MIERKRMVIGFLLLYTCFLSTIIKKKVEPVTHKLNVESIHEKKIYAYCGDKYIAKVLSKAKRPYIMAAIAKVESDYRPRIIGDGGDSFGLFQINRRFHRWPDDRLELQLIASERILTPLIVKHGVEGGIRRYNGRGSAARSYARRVIKISREIEHEILL